MTAQTPSFSRSVPEGDTHERAVCDRCGFVSYDNPRIIVGSVPRDEQGRFLLCRRAIEPRRGFWTLPAGFLELSETPEEGARREAMEEARAALDLGPLLAIYTVTRISQVQLFYRARLTSTPEAGEESLEVALFRHEEIPIKALAFPTVASAIAHELEAERLAARGLAFSPFTHWEQP
ncbi:MAG: NUDIX hydrolase [Hyphomicrobiaceae bacterium]|nr:NUDIX hydrolase [Hyphomicrobiaceae bacterium]